MISPGQIGKVKKMRLKGLKRREVQELVVRMGGYRAVIQGKGLRRDHVVSLTFDDKAAIANGSHFLSARASWIENKGCTIWLRRRKGPFSAQAQELIGHVAKLLYLFPVVLEDMRTTTYFLTPGGWHTFIELLRDEAELDKRVVRCFTSKAKIPLVLSETHTVILEFEGQLVIKDDSVQFDPTTTPIEGDTGLEPSADEWLVAAAQVDFSDSIMRRMGETTNGLSVKVIDRTTFKAIGPIDGKDITGWILRAALDCGVVFSQCDLAEYDIPLSTQYVNTGSN